jgi:electron transfer flavoprotein alpha subunit
VFAVLVKVVPDREDVGFDPHRRTVVRDGVRLFLNPFDQRAVRVALELRRPGEPVTLLSMGPPAAAEALREPLALGVDRAVLVTDPALRGSDTLVTARVLSRALRRIPFRVVLAGAWTTDSETGQVAPEVAALLGVPVVTSARRIGRDPGGPGLEVTFDTDVGWSRVRLEPPCVLSVGEKIAKPLHAVPEAVEAVPLSRVERLSSEELGLPSGSVGQAGSPTVVDALREGGVHRDPRRFATGAAADRCAAAVARIAELLGGPAPDEPPVPPLRGPLRPADEAVVLVTDRGGALEPRALPLLTAVRQRLAPGWPTAAWVGGPVPAVDARRIAAAGAARLVRVAAPVPLTARLGALALEGVVDQSPGAGVMLALAEPYARDALASLAARRGLGLVGDALDVVVGAEGEPRWVKPAFGGSVLAEVRSRTRPALVTVRPGAFGGATVPDPSVLDVEEVAVDLPRAEVEWLEDGAEPTDGWGDLDAAPVVIAVGTGLGGPDHLGRLDGLRRRTGAAVAGSRRVVDAGWLPRRLQVGLTGRAPAPELGILVGIGGSANHLAGWHRARTLLAINPDERARVFSAVDVGLVGRWEDLIDPLAEALEPLARRRGWPAASP